LPFFLRAVYTFSTLVPLGIVYPLVFGRVFVPFH
jgi:hypothetical protein